MDGSIVGKTITVQYFEETKNDKGGISLRFPTVKTYRKGDDGEYGDHPKVFEVNDVANAINSEYRGMNVTKWGPTCVTLYTYDMLGKRAVGKIKYKDIILK
jgi:hypothetical protein